MKKILMMAALVATAIFTTTSCSDDEVVRGVAESGTPISFSASTRPMSTRTAYGTNLNGGKWDINWVEGDKVTIFCPEASTDIEGTKKANSAEFTVTSMASATDKTVYGIVGGTLYWGEADAHHFYEVYPSSRFESMSATSGDESITVSANLPSTQYATLQPDGHYADMSAALMVGTTTVNRTSAPTPIELPFTAITTAVDIVVSAAERTVYTVKSLTIANTESDTDYTPLAGKFTYNTATGAFASSDESEAYNVQVELPEPQVLEQGKDLKVTVFLRGDFSKSIKVTVNADIPNPRLTTEIIPVSVSKTGTDANLLARLCRNHINLGPAPDPSTPGGAEEDDPVIKPMSGEWWVSHVPSNVYVSRMSLPGVYDACSFLEQQLDRDRAQNKLWTNQDNMFYEQMSAYLNGGNRVFDFKPSYKDGSWVVARGTTDGVYREIDFLQMVQATDDWLKDHTTEFVVFIMSDYGWQTPTGYKENISSKLKDIIPARRLLESFDANITVAEARGKILVINASEADNPIGISVNGWRLNDAVIYKGDKCDADGVDKSGYFENQAYYGYPMGKGKIYVQDWNNVGNMANNIITRKNEFVNQTIKAAAENNNEFNWFFTSITLRRAGNSAAVVGYAEASNKLRESAKEKIKGLSSASNYHSCGMIFQAYSASEDPASSLESVIWHNNDPYFKQASANQ